MRTFTEDEIRAALDDIQKRYRSVYHTSDRVLRESLQEAQSAAIDDVREVLNIRPKRTEDDIAKDALAELRKPRPAFSELMKLSIELNERGKSK